MNNCPFCTSTIKASKTQNLQWKNLFWLQCSHCNGGHRIPYVSELDDHLADVSVTYLNYGKSADMFLETAHTKANWLKTYLKTRSVFIEIGPGLGQVILKLRSSNDNVTFAAIEPNDVFSNNLASSGILVQSNLDPKAIYEFIQSTCKGQPTVVFLDNCLEHVAFPKDLIENIKNALPIGSVIVGEVPNEKGLHWRAPVQDYLRGFSKAPTFPGHINLFQKNALKLTLNSIRSRVWQHPLRTKGQIRYLSQNSRIGTKIKLALLLLQLTQLDRLMGLAYWLRFEVLITDGQQ